MKEKGQEEFLDEVYETAVELKSIQEQKLMVDSSLYTHKMLSGDIW